MRYVRMTLLSAAATCVLPFATPAIAELGHPSGCANCPPIEIAAPTQGSDREGGDRINTEHRLAVGGDGAGARGAAQTPHSRTPSAIEAMILAGNSTSKPSTVRAAS
jgi:hypothetical protein